MTFIGLKKPKQQKVSDKLQPGDDSPKIEKCVGEKPYKLITFLRHPGCPFAESTLKEIRNISDKYKNIDFIIITHGNEKICHSWLHSIGGTDTIHAIHDEDRSIYGSFGLGYTNFWHFIGFKSLMGVVKLVFKGIRNRKATGTRWQSAGSFLVGPEEKILWAHIPKSAEEIPNFEKTINQFL